MPRQQRPLLRGKRILVVDADEGVRIAAHELLGRYGCEVETAHNAEEAFVMVRSFHYDAVIADIRLPDMTGFECFYQIKQIHEHLPVILMTGFGYDPAHSIVKARQHGLKSVLYKPFRLEQLLDGSREGRLLPGRRRRARTMQSPMTIAGLGRLLSPLAVASVSTATSPKSQETLPRRTAAADRASAPAVC